MYSVHQKKISFSKKYQIKCYCAKTVLSFTVFKKHLKFATICETENGHKEEKGANLRREKKVRLSSVFKWGVDTTILYLVHCVSVYFREED